MTDTIVAVSRQRPSDRVDRVREGGVYVALTLVIVVNLIVTDNFLTVGNITLQLIQVVPILLVSLGLALSIGTEGIDLSVGAVMAIAAAALSLSLGLGTVPALLIALAAGAAAGAFNGILIAFVGIQPIVATLGMLVGGRGLAQLLVGGRQRRINDGFVLGLARTRIAGQVPVSVVIAAVLVLIVAWVTRRTTFGRYTVSIGGNRRACIYAGLPVRGTLMGVYVVSGTLAALAGVLATARLGASDTPNVGRLIELSGITAVVVGGTPLSGGRVRIMGTVAGALLIQCLNATFIMNNLPFTHAQMIQAAIIVAAVYVQRARVA